MPILLILLLLVAFGFLCGIAAAPRGKSPVNWFIYGILFGPFALIAILVGSPYSPETHKLCPDCSEFVLKSARVCKHCGCKFKAEDASEGKRS